MTAAMAMPGNTAETFLVHFFGIETASPVLGLPSSALSTNRPFSSLSPSTRAPASDNSPSSGAGSGQGSGSGSPISIGTPDQKGERHASGPGSSQASRPQSASASRSAPVCTRTGTSASSKRSSPACASQASR